MFHFAMNAFMLITTATLQLNNGKANPGKTDSISNFTSLQFMRSYIDKMTLSQCTNVTVSAFMSFSTMDLQ